MIVRPSIGYRPSVPETGDVTRVEVLGEFPPELLDEAWEFYRAMFTPLVTLSATRHLMFRQEFDALVADPRTISYVTRDAGGVTGLAVMTDDLDAVPLISPPFFEARWPELYAQRRIIYCVFISAIPGPRGDGVFVDLQREIYGRMVAPVGGSVVLDICMYNEERLKLPWAVEGILTQITGGAQATRVDSQSYWLYEFSAAS